MHGKHAQRRRTSIFPLLLPEQDEAMMSILHYFKPPLPLYERESLLTHTRPRLSCASLNIFGRRGGSEKKSHESLSNENFANEKKANYGMYTLFTLRISYVVLF